MYKVEALLQRWYNRLYQIVFKRPVPGRKKSPWFRRHRLRYVGFKPRFECHVFVWVSVSMKRSRSPDDARSQSAPLQTNNITNNGTLNLHNYLAPVAGPGPTTASGTAALPRPKPNDRPPNLFGQDKRVLRARFKYGGTYYLARLGARRRAVCWMTSRRPLRRASWSSTTAP